MRNLSCVMLLMISLIAAGAFGAPGPQEGRFYLHGGAAVYSPADDLFNENPLGPVLGIGYGLTDRWAVELMHSRFEIDYAQGGISGSDKTRLTWLDFLWEFQGDERWQPFLVFGGGISDSSRGPFGDEKETQLNAGIGVFRALNDRFSVRGDIRAVIGDEEGSLEPYAGLGISALLGSLTTAAKSANVADADGDGVPDGRDVCPETPADALVDQSGCALDGDRDGVADWADACPDTVGGALVDERGCSVMLDEKVTIDLNLEFDTNSPELRQEHSAEIRRVADFLKQYPTASAVIEGHTDSDGVTAYNLRLSEQRATAVLDNLIREHGIAEDRLAAVGYGESRPVADNDSPVGKQANRRVSVVVSGSGSVAQERDR